MLYQSEGTDDFLSSDAISHFALMHSKTEVSSPSSGGAASILGEPHESCPQNTCILIVDDDEWTRDVLVDILAHSRYQVCSVGSAEDALELLRRMRFDMLFSDVVLTGMSGLELTARIVQSYPHLPVVMMTAHRDPNLMRAAMRNGASDFVTKPFHNDSLPLVIERNLERNALERERSREHEDALMVTTVQALAAAIDAKEPYTAEHSRRVTELAMAVAEVMGLSKTEKRFLEMAALVHDVGKIAVPDGILNKPGPLSSEEWQCMQQHSIRGQEIVGHAVQLAKVADIVRHHHEWMNGNGYPDGLSGEAIPLLARIITVADAYEVMTNDRVYRKRFAAEEALHRLQAASGTQFDPEVVSAFLTMCTRTHRQTDSTE